MKKLLCFVICLIFLLSSVVVSASALGVNAKGAALINGHTGELLYSYNANEKLPMASTTKIMTGLLLCELADFEKEITVTDQMVRVEGSSMGLLAGDRVTFHDLLYGLMLSSGNDAANVIAYGISGSILEFVKLMNRRAKELGLSSTSFVTPSGLDAKEHYTTAADLARLTFYAMQNTKFREAVASGSATLCYGNPPYKRTLTNHNKLLNMYEGAIGVKTGYTKKSGRCLVSAAERDGKLLIAVTLNSSDDWNEHKKMLDYGFSVVQKITIGEKKTYEIPIVGGEANNLKVKVEPLELSCSKQEEFEYQIYLPRFLYAPVKKGDIVGSIVYKKDNEIINKTEIKAEASISAASIKPNPLRTIKEIYKYIFLMIWEK